LKLKLSPEKTKIIHARKKGVEFLGFHFNGRWRRPKEKARKKFKEEIKRRTRRQQPISLETVIRFLNPVILGWGNYFKGGTVKKLYGDLDGYIRARLRSFKAKRRTWGTILYTLPQSELKEMGLISLSSLLDESVSCKGKKPDEKPCTENPSARFDEEAEVERPLLYSTARYALRAYVSMRRGEHNADERRFVASVLIQVLFLRRAGARLQYGRSRKEVEDRGVAE